MTLLNLLIPLQIQLHMKRSLELNFLSSSLNSLMGMLVTKWSTFWDGYEAFIHKNTTIDKFNYLNSIMEKTASEKPFQVYPIHNCIKLWGGYRFFEGHIWNKQMIINKHLKGLLNEAPVTSKNDLKGLMLVMLVMPPTHPWNFRNLLT